MSTTEWDQEKLAGVRAFFEAYFGLEMPDPEPGIELEAHTTLTRQNQPEFYADAPWRLEPDLGEIPLLFVIREANVEEPGLGPWRLDELRIEERLNNGVWRKVRGYRPSQLPDVDPEGFFASSFWSYSTRLRLQTLQGIDTGKRGQVARLRVVFAGRFPPYDELDESPRRYLQVHLAEHALPLGRAATNENPRRWFYGDTHYHSSYTNDIWEFGNPVRDARYAGRAIGLDWLVITDHSCDLDDQDPEFGSLTRWARLRQELAKPSISDKHFRMIRGEEVTLLNASGGYVHMLVMGPLKDMIPGGFWSEGDSTIKWFAKLVNRLVSALGGYPKDAVERLFGLVLNFEQVLARLPANALIFAAHPYDQAQPPFLKSTWTEEELADHRLTGHEFWNGRSRRQTEPLVDPTDDPFAEPEWNDADKLKKRDKARVERLQELVEKWEAVLQQGIDEWAAGDERPNLRPVFIGGSDAHGDFSYSVGVGWNYREHGYITDNALGRVRTVIHLPRHASSRVPTQAQVLSALEGGACIVTDGPVVELSLRCDGQVAHVGDVLALSGDDMPEMTIRGYSTQEFGPVEEAEVITYLKGQQDNHPKRTKVCAGPPTMLEVEGRRGYCRVQAWTVGRDGERFCCFTNPIWLRIADGEKRQLRVAVESH
jgi:hypothetical protein